MRIRKLITIISIVMIIFTLSGCGKNSTIPGSKQENAPLAASELKKVTINSKVLKKNMKFNLYLPKGYSAENKYPVLYMIHGYSGNEDSWMPELKLDKRADELINEKRIKPLIIVAPQMDNSFGLNTSGSTRVMGTPPNNSLDEGMYEDYLCNELIPYIDSHYSTETSRENRFIGGLSMGGFIALHTAFVHTGMFSKAGGHSPAIVLDDTPNTPNSWLYPNESVRSERDPVYIAQEKDLKMLNVYLDCGDKDGYRFYQGCEKLYNILQSKGVSSQYHLNPGEHDGHYWESNAEKYLLFYAGI